MTRGMLVGVLATVATMAYPMESRAAGVVRVGIMFQHDDYRRHDAYRLGQDRGEEDGRSAGWEDGRNDRRFNIDHDPRYRRGTDGYRPSFGSRRAYISGYQEGFERAYRRGFEAGRRRDRREDRRDDRRDDRDRDRR